MHTSANKQKITQNLNNPNSFEFTGIGVARKGGARASPPNRNATNDKSVTKSFVFHFQFLLASLSTTVQEYNSNYQ